MYVAGVKIHVGTFEYTFAERKGPAVCRSNCAKPSASVNLSVLTAEFSAKLKKHESRVFSLLPRIPKVCTDLCRLRSWTTDLKPQLRAGCYALYDNTYREPSRYSGCRYTNPPVTGNRSAHLGRVRYPLVRLHRNKSYRYVQTLARARARVCKQRSNYASEVSCANINGKWASLGEGE